jgi:hypothetical protein
VRGVRNKIESKNADGPSHSVIGACSGGSSCETSRYEEVDNEQKFRIKVCFRVGEIHFPLARSMQSVQGERTKDEVDL